MPITKNVIVACDNCDAFAEVFECRLDKLRDEGWFFSRYVRNTFCPKVDCQRVGKATDERLETTIFNPDRLNLDKTKKGRAKSRDGGIE